MDSSLRSKAPTASKPGDSVLVSAIQGVSPALKVNGRDSHVRKSRKEHRHQLRPSALLAARVESFTNHDDAAKGELIDVHQEPASRLGAHTVPVDPLASRDRPEPLVDVIDQAFLDHAGSEHVRTIGGPDGLVDEGDTAAGHL